MTLKNIFTTFSRISDGPFSELDLKMVRLLVSLKFKRTTKLTTEIHLT